MNDNSVESRYDPIATLARSLFAFALAAWLPLCVAFVMLLGAPASPQASYARLHSLIVLGAGSCALLVLLGAIWIYRGDHARSWRVATTLVARFASPGPAFALVIALLELNILAQAMLKDIAPAIVGPARFLLLGWSLIFAGFVLIIHWRAIHQAVSKHCRGLAGAGIALAALGFVAALAILTVRLVNETGWHERLRGSLDYRLLRFIDDGGAPFAADFWAEQSQTRVRWLPYSYWVVAPFDGQFIHVDKSGLRRTVSEALASGLSSVYFFGGSTVWGEGARDAYTIPSQVSQLLAQDERRAVVRNYGQTGYVSGQDLILFQRQLALGNAPDVAVFYQGFNDILSAYAQGHAGLPFSESQRVDDVETGRLLRQGQPVLRQQERGIADLDWQLAIAGGKSPAEIIDIWLANRRLIQAAAREFGVDTLFVWQPALFAKRNLAAFENRYARQMERSLPGFLELYEQVDRLLRKAAEADPMDDLLIISDLFAENDAEIFFDEVHINEVGNRFVAELLSGAIAELLHSR